MNLFIRIASMFTLALLLSGPGKTVAQQAKAVPVSTVKAVYRSLESTLDLKGEVRAFAEVTVYSKVNGIIERLLVDIGSTVRTGEPIAVVEHKGETAKRAQLAAAVQVAEAQFENAQLEKQRAEGLYGENSISKQKYDFAIAQYKIAAANLEAAKKALQEMDVRLADFTIRAPISGVVSARFIDQGAMDSPQLPIVSITNLDSLKILSQVTETDVANLIKGGKATVRVDAYPQEQFQGVVSIVNPALDPKTHTMGFEVHLKDRRSILKPGMFARITLLLGTRKVLVVPRECLLRLPGTGVYYAFVVENGVAVKRADIKIGMSKGNLVEITSGLKQGDELVVAGQGLLKTGTPVAVTGSGGTEQ